MSARRDELDAAAIRAALPAAIGARVRIECIASIDSTNAELLRRGATQPDLAVLVADQQSAGRGRRGREWHSPPGANLYCSILRRADGGTRAYAGLSLVVGIACADALHALGATEVSLKWPNDLLARDAKLGGVLIELAPDAAVIGIGLNVRMPPADAGSIDQRWIDLAALGVGTTRNELVARLLQHLVPALDVFARDGLVPFLARWQRLDGFASRPVRVDAGHERVDGIARGIAADGGLRVECDGRERVFHSADVSLRRA